MLRKVKKAKEVLVQFVAVSLLTSDPVDSFLEVVKLSCHIPEILTKVLRLWIFIFFKFNYVMYVMYAKIVLQLHV